MVRLIIRVLAIMFAILLLTSCSADSVSESIAARESKLATKEVDLVTREAILATREADTFPSEVPFAREIDKSTWQIGPMGPEPDLNFDLEIKLLESKWLELNKQAALQVKVRITNLGPTATGEGLSYFHLIDKDRALGRFKIIVDAPGCEWEDVTLLKGGSIEKCLTFTGNFTNDVELIYAPYKKDTLDESRYIRFTIAR